MKKLLSAGFVVLIGLTGTVHAASNYNPGCQKTFWNSTWFGLSYFIGQCK